MPPILCYTTGATLVMGLFVFRPTARTFQLNTWGEKSDKQPHPESGGESPNRCRSRWQPVLDGAFCVAFRGRG